MATIKLVLESLAPCPCQTKPCFHAQDFIPSHPVTTCLWGSWSLCVQCRSNDVQWDCQPTGYSLKQKDGDKPPSRILSDAWMARMSCATGWQCATITVSNIILPRISKCTRKVNFFSSNDGGITNLDKNWMEDQYYRQHITEAASKPDNYSLWLAHRELGKKKQQEEIYRN